MLQTAKVVRLIFTFVFLGVLLLCHAYLPLTIDVNIPDYPRVGRDAFFYTSIGLFLFINLATYFFRYKADRSGMTPYRRLGVHLLAPVLYFSSAMLIGYITVFNNAQDIDPGDFNYLNYLAPGLILAWFFTFLFVSIRRL